MVEVDEEVGEEPAPVPPALGLELDDVAKTYAATRSSTDSSAPAPASASFCERVTPTSYGAA